MKRSLLALSFSAAVFACTPQCRAQVTSNVLDRVLLIQTNGKEGTAFTIDVDGKQYLITAKHVVAGLPENQETGVRVMRKSGWKPLDVKVLRCATRSTSQFSCHESNSRSLSHSNHRQWA